MLMNFAELFYPTRSNKPRKGRSWTVSKHLVYHSVNNPGIAVLTHIARQRLVAITLTRLINDNTPQTQRIHNATDLQ